MTLLIIKEHYMSKACFSEQETRRAGAFLLYPHELIYCFNCKKDSPSHFGGHPHITVHRQSIH